MTAILWIVAILLPICNHAAYLRCVPPRDNENIDTFDIKRGDSVEGSRGYRQKTFVRNPNYKCKLADFIYQKEC